MYNSHMYKLECVVDNIEHFVAISMLYHYYTITTIPSRNLVDHI